MVDLGHCIINRYHSYFMGNHELPIDLIHACLESTEIHRFFLFLLGKANTFQGVVNPRRLLLLLLADAAWAGEDRPDVCPRCSK
jgi:hypothetical protein